MGQAGSGGRQFSPPLTPISQSMQVTRRAISVPITQHPSHAPTSSQDETPKPKNMESGSFKRRDISFSVPPVETPRSPVAAEVSSPRVRMKRVRTTSMGPPASPVTSSSRAKTVRRLPRPRQVRDEEKDEDESEDETNFLRMPASQPTPNKRMRSESQAVEELLGRDEPLPAPIAGNTRWSPSQESQSSAPLQPTSAQGMPPPSQQDEALPMRHDEPLPASVAEDPRPSPSQASQSSEAPSQPTPGQGMLPRREQDEAPAQVSRDGQVCGSSSQGSQSSVASSQQTPTKRIRSETKQTKALPVRCDELLQAPIAEDAGSSASQASQNSAAPSHPTRAQSMPPPSSSRSTPAQALKPPGPSQPTPARRVKSKSQPTKTLSERCDKALPAPLAKETRPSPSQASQSSVVALQSSMEPSQPTSDQSIQPPSSSQQTPTKRTMSESKQSGAPAPVRREGQVTRSSPSLGQVGGPSSSHEQRARLSPHQRGQSSAAPSQPTPARPPSSSQPPPARPPSSSQPTPDRRMRTRSQPAEAPAVLPNGQVAGSRSRSHQSQRGQSSVASQREPSHPTLAQDIRPSSLSQLTALAARRDEQVHPNPSQGSQSSGYLEAVHEPSSDTLRSEYFMMPVIDPPERWERTNSTSPERTRRTSRGSSTDSSLPLASPAKRKAAVLAEEKTRTLVIKARRSTTKDDDNVVVSAQRRSSTAIDVDAEDTSVIRPGARRLFRTQSASTVAPRSLAATSPPVVNAHAFSSLESILMPAMPSADASLEALAVDDVNGLAQAWLLISQTHTHVQLLNDRLQSTLSSLGISNRNDGSRLNAYRKQADRAARWANALARQTHIALRTGAKSIEVCEFPEAPPRNPRRTSSQRASIQSSQLPRTQ